MKRLIANTSTETNFVQTDAELSVLEGAPASLPTVKAAASTSVTERPHILIRRKARWSRRASH